MNICVSSQNKVLVEIISNFQRFIVKEMKFPCAINSVVVPGAVNILVGLNGLSFLRNNDHVVLNKQNTIYWNIEQPLKINSEDRQLILEKCAFIFGFYEPDWMRFYFPRIELLKIKCEKTIDVLFIGTKNQNRNAFMEKLINLGLNVVYGSGKYGKTKIELLSQARIVVNLHFYHHSQQEIPRIMDALTYKCFVITERSENQEFDSLLRKCAAVKICSKEWMIEKIKQTLKRTTFPVQNVDKFLAKYDTAIKHQFETIMTHIEQ